MYSKINTLGVVNKILVFFWLIIVSFFSVNLWYAVECSYDWWWNVVDALENCVDDMSLVKTENMKDEKWNIISSDNLKVDDGFKTVLINWTKKIATYLAFWAIFAIAFGSLKMVLSWWEEEAIKKWKDIIKWWIIWLLWVVSAGFIISVVVKVVYTIWW